MTIIFIVCYIGLTVFAGFAKDLDGHEIVGSVNLGFMLIGLNYPAVMDSRSIIYGASLPASFSAL